MTLNITLRFVFMLLSVFSVPVYADQIDIQAQQLDVDNAENKAIFTGDVSVVQEELTLTADKVTVFYTNDEEATDDIEKIHANGHVKVVKGSRTATAKRAVYTPSEDIVMLFDTVAIHEKGKSNALYGEQVHYDLEKDKVTVRGGARGSDATKGRVRGTFESKKTNKTPKKQIVEAQNVDASQAEGAQTKALQTKALGTEELQVETPAVPAMHSGVAPQGASGP